ncbi:hypothetical protein [Sinomonas soli]
MTGQEFPTNLFFDARDRAELRPAEYFHTAKTTPAEQAAAAMKLRDELERRSRLVSRAVQDVERLRRALHTLRDFDSTGNGDQAIDHVRVAKIRAARAVEDTLRELEASYRRHEDNTRRAEAGEDPEPAETPGPVTEGLIAGFHVQTFPTPAEVANNITRHQRAIALGGSFL